jgi:hypothetical protein
MRTVNRLPIPTACHQLRPTESLKTYAIATLEPKVAGKTGAPSVLCFDAQLRSESAQSLRPSILKACLRQYSSEPYNLTDLLDDRFARWDSTN